MYKLTIHQINEFEEIKLSLKFDSLERAMRAFDACYHSEDIPNLKLEGPDGRVLNEVS